MNGWLADTADRIRRDIYGDAVYVRGLIEFSNYCKNDCFYCGIRKSNKNVNSVDFFTHSLYSFSREWDLHIHKNDESFSSERSESRYLFKVFLHLYVNL